ncbi:hypothetical protein ACNF42_07920 [Cuniculiplasma sp. SKW3]|uniref:hypothetical protein n=1 Tax=Cuniculiplasma sp. SKW3 TaxID=3400170 RepID=UPI003FD3A49D
MSSEDIISSIEEKGKKEIARINSECESNLGKIETDKKNAMDEIEKKWSKKIQEDMANLTRRGEDESRLEYRSIIMNKKSSEVSKFVDSSESFYDKIRDIKGYDSFIAESVSKALSELGKNCKVIVSSKDKKIVSKIEGDFKTEETVKEQIGIVAISKDGKRILDLTLHSLILENRQELEEMLLSIMGAN